MEIENMKTKNIILSAIIATLPFGAWAEQTFVYTNTPAAVAANGTIKIASSYSPYATNEPTVADQTHIATTAYVKGAYNDAIAALNKLGTEMQTKLTNTVTGDNIGEQVMSSYAFMDILSSDAGDSYDNNLVTTTAVIDGIKSQRVEIYTTWDTNDTTDVAFKTVLPDD